LDSGVQDISRLDTIGDLRILKRHIKKKYVEDNLKYRPIVQAFYGFPNKLTDFNGFLTDYWQTFDPE
jgi:hypothetical protein